MFNQIKDLAGGEFYLITSLLLFMVFFIIVGIYLLKLNKQHIEIMGLLPIQENQPDEHEED
ncbi:hypothetical protein [Pedobacter endophyticus]|uniref:Cbb3-type cytochrome oxidase component FixQ n=1 Tax=Pedobacter endophyticus TaxID=2789740 RepID=A0A7S9Q0K0_9SPHI|nr:hypothetical protein [Pedobacter endophyticus]QPH40866.1 hypothetical protein IZT61_06265 [Pedobacter endophyticus]